MAGLINDLILTLNEMNDLYEQLITTGKEKRDVIIKNDIESLQKINENENILVGKTLKLDKKREELFSDIAFVLNKNPEEITLTKLIEYIDKQNEVNDVIAAKEKAEKLLAELKKTNESNRTLIEESLNQAEFSMNLLRGSLSKRPYYCDTLGNEIPTGERLFDIKQ